MEEVSTSTTENIQFSMDYIEDLELPVVIITSEYHVYRGMEIARKAGLVNISGLRANPGPIMGFIIMCGRLCRPEGLYRRKFINLGRERQWT